MAEPSLPPPPPYFLQQGLSPIQDSPIQLLDGQCAPVNLVYLSPSTEITGFVCVWGIWAQVLMVVWQVLPEPSSHSPQSLFKAPEKVNSRTFSLELNHYVTLDSSPPSLSLQSCRLQDRNSPNLFRLHFSVHIKNE